MKNLLKIIEEGREGFNKTFPCLDQQCDGEGTTASINRNTGEPEPEQCEYCYRERFPHKDHLTKHTKAILTNQIERMEKSKKPVIENMLLDDPVFQERGMDGVKAHNAALQTQIEYLEDVIKKLW